MTSLASGSVFSGYVYYMCMNSMGPALAQDLFFIPPSHFTHGPLLYPPPPPHDLSSIPPSPISPMDLSSIPPPPPSHPWTSPLSTLPHLTHGPLLYPPPPPPLP